MVKVALLGCGYWGKNIARVLHQLGALSHICDRDAAAGIVAEELGVPWSPDAADILSSPGIEAVAVATPAATHYSAVKAALGAGKHVFVEKPLALKTDQAFELGLLAERSELTLMVGHLLRYHPAFLSMSSLVRGGEIGKLRYIYSNRLNMGKLRKEENVLWSLAPHDISMILALVDEAPTGVAAWGHAYLQESIPDFTIAHLQFDGQVRAHVNVSWLNPFKEQKLVAIGDSGMMVFDDTQAGPGKLLLFRHGVDWRDGAPVAVKGEAEPIPFVQVEPLVSEMAHFLECVAQRRRPRTDQWEGARVLAVLSAAQASMNAGGRPVEVVTADPDAGASSPPPFFVHSTAVVDAGVEIGEGTKIWHFSHVLRSSRIGKHCSIGQNVMIGPDVSIGNGCKIQNNVSLYNGVTLEDDVFCGPSMVFTNVLTPRAHVERKSEFAPTLVRRGATIGANATIVCGTTIGRYAMVGAGAVVTRDVPDHALLVGNPARQIGWVSASGERLGPDLVCPRTGKRYREASSGLAPVSD